MRLAEVVTLLISLAVLVCSTLYRTITWCWLSPPFTIGFFRISPNTRAGKTSPTRISSPLHEIKPAYDVVVIGSGYGGGVAASRMARAQPKQSACVLESGDERWPQELGVLSWRVSDFLLGSPDSAARLWSSVPGLSSATTDTFREGSWLVSMDLWAQVECFHG